MTKSALILFEYLYGKCIGDNHYEYEPTARSLKIIDNFVNKLPISCGEDWLFNFMCFGFSKFVNLSTRAGKNKVYLGWIIGLKALKKYREASEEELYYSEKFQMEYLILNILTKNISPVNSLSYKNRERNRFFGTDRGFIHCKENELFEHKNKYCIGCKFRKYCNEVSN